MRLSRALVQHKNREGTVYYVLPEYGYDIKRILVSEKPHDVISYESGTEERKTLSEKIVYVELTHYANSRDITDLNSSFSHLKVILIKQDGFEEMALTDFLTYAIPSGRLNKIRELQTANIQAYNTALFYISNIGGVRTLAEVLESALDKYSVISGNSYEGAYVMHKEPVTNIATQYPMLAVEIGLLDAEQQLMTITNNIGEEGELIDDRR